MFIGLESQFLDICKKIVPALHKYYGHKPGAREIRFFEEHIHADEVHGSKVSPSSRNMPTPRSYRASLSKRWKRLLFGGGVT